jgi:hypothetical protein
LKQKQAYTIPSDPVKFGGSIIFVIITGIMTLAGVELDYPVADPWFLFIVGIGCAVITSKSYVLDPQRLTERWMYIPVHRVRWEFVKQVLLFDRSNDDKKTQGEAIFVVTYFGCDDFDPKADTVSTYLSRYRKLVTLIPIPKKKKHIYKVLFAQTFGAVEEFE